MNTNRKRLAFVSGTALTLVLTGTSLVSAQTPDTTTPRGGDAGMGAQHGPGMGDMGGRGGRGGFGGRGGDMGGGGDRGEAVLGRIDNLVSQETVTLDADGNTLTSRLQHGTVSAVADGSLSIDLGTGETVTIATDANTAAYGWSTTDRPARTEIAVADVTVGADVVVWSQSQDDGGFLAERIAVVPAVADATPADSVTPQASPATVG